MNSCRKQHWIRFAAFLGVLLIALCGCRDGRSTSSHSIKQIKIGVALYRSDDTFISILSDSFQKIAKQKESEYNCKVILNSVDAKGSQTIQNDQMDKFISQKYDVICVNIVDRTAASTMIDKAKSANIPIVFFNREPVQEDMNRWQKTYYVGTQAEMSGILQAKMVAGAYGKNPANIDKNGDGKLQYVILEGEQGHQDALIRTESCIKTIIQYGIEMDKLANDTANWQRSEGKARMSEWIREYHNAIEVVFSNNDDMALGALDAIKDSALGDRAPVVVGIDGTPAALEAVHEGTMLGTVLSDSKAQAQAIFDLAYTAAMKGDISRVAGLQNGKYIRISHTEVTADNVGQYLQP